MIDGSVGSWSDLTEYVWSLHVLPPDWTPPYCRAGSRVLQNYQLNLESLNTELSRSYQPTGHCSRPAPHVFRMSREGIRLLRAAEYWTNYLFLAPTHLIITRTYQIEFPHLLLIWCQKLSGYFQTFEWINSLLTLDWSKFCAMLWWQPILCQTKLCL